jgi:hypothetical protein
MEGEDVTEKYLSAAVPTEVKHENTEHFHDALISSNVDMNSTRSYSQWEIFG